MRLLLDVHFSPLIAAQLHERGHDVRAAADDARVRQLSDEALLEHTVAGARALLTNIARDFLRSWGSGHERARTTTDCC